MRLKRLASAALALALVLTFTRPSLAADVFLYGAANNRLFPCLDYYMPVNLANGLVVPSRLLTDGNLGLRYTYDSGSRIFKLSDSSRTITFDMGNNNTYDNRQQYTQMAFEASGVTYLPLDFLCLYFSDLTYRAISTDYGTVLQVLNRSFSTSDEKFRELNNEQLARQADRYRELNGLPSTGGGSGTTTTPPNQQVPSPPPYVVLSFDITDSTQSRDMMELLEPYSVPAAFFVSRESMDQNHSLMRQLSGRYTVGILGDAKDGFYESPEEMSMGLDDANKVLREATLAQTRMARSPDISVELSAEQNTELESSGYILMDDALLPDPKLKTTKQAGDLIKRLNRSGGVNVIRLPDSPDRQELTEDLMERLEAESAVFLELIPIHG